MTVANIEVPTEEIAAMCRRNGVRRLALFGSVLTGRFSEHSDIDVLIEFRPNERVGFFRLADIQDELSRLLDGRTVDLRTPMDLSRGLCRAPRPVPTCPPRIRPPFQDK